MKLSKMAIFYISIGLIIVGAFAFTRIKNSDLFAKKEKKSFTQTVEYQTVDEPSTILPTGVSYIKNSGRNGEMTSTFLYVYTDKGEVKSKNLVDQKYTIPVVNKVIVVGQKSLDEFSKGIRGKAQEFYNNYKDGKYTGASKWLKHVSGSDKIPYTDDTIKDAVKDTEFSIKEITIGEPKVSFGTYWNSIHDSLSEVDISADIPIQVKSSSKLSAERVVDFNKQAYFDVVNNEWLFAPVGPVLFAPGSETVHFNPSSSDDKGVGGTLKVDRVIQWVPMANANNNFSLILIFTGKFDNDKNFKRVRFDDVRDDLGNTYWGADATPYSVKDDKDSPQQDLVWANVGVDLKKIYGAKKLSLKISEVAIDPIVYVFGGGMVIHPRDFTITGISIN